MDYLAALKELYPNEYPKISGNLASAISADNEKELNKVFQQYFSGPESKILLEGQIAVYSRKTRPNPTDFEAQAPAFLAVEKSALKSLQAILTVTGNVNARADPSNPEASPTLLMIAAEGGNYDMAQFLIGMGINVNAVVQGDSGNCEDTALSLAAQKGYLKFVRLLVDSGAEIGMRAAESAIRSDSGLSPTLEYFIEKRPELKTISDPTFGTTLLHVASLLGNLSTVRWLVTQGANPNVIARGGFTPRDITESESVRKYLKSVGGLTRADIDTSYLSQQPQSTHVEKREITDLVDRLELLEERCGVRLEGLYAVCGGLVTTGKGEFTVEVNCDVIGTGAALERSFSLRLNAYNPTGQLLKTEAIFISSGDFSGFQSCSFHLYCDQFPHRLRLFPS